MRNGLYDSFGNSAAVDALVYVDPSQPKYSFSLEDFLVAWFGGGIQSLGIFLYFGREKGHVCIYRRLCARMAWLPRHAAVDSGDTLCVPVTIDPFLLG